MTSKGRIKPPKEPMYRAADVQRLLGNVSIELTMAGMQVLREQFEFTPEQSQAWLDATLARARKNRGGS